jgi:small subunit ribosomal protein S4
MATSRPQARQMVAHGHVLVNGKRVSIPSYVASPGDEIALAERTKSRESFLKTVVEKRLNIGIKVPDWLELNKQDYKGVILRNPERVEIKTPIEEHLIVELYSK